MSTVFSGTKWCGAMLLVMLFATFRECRVVKLAGIKLLKATDQMRKESRLGEWMFIFPGTKWCGAGSTAKNYDDLGALKNTDKCCRAHDKCPDVIEKMETSEKYNLTNERLYTSLSCDCDKAFYDCLKGLNTIDSNIVGDLYFNIIGQQCFKREAKIVKCLSYATPIMRRCAEYELDDDSEEVYQWFDVPIY